MCHNYLSDIGVAKRRRRVKLVATVGSVRHRAPKLGFDIREPRHTLTGACLHISRDVGEGWYGEAETYLCLDWVLLLLIECALNLVEMNEKWKDQLSSCLFLLCQTVFAPKQQIAKEIRLLDLEALLEATPTLTFQPRRMTVMNR